MTKKGKKGAGEGSSEFVLVDLHWTVGLAGFGSFGPGTDIRVPREFARQLDLEVKGDAESDEDRLAARAEEEETDVDTLRAGERRGPPDDALTPRMRKAVRERAEAEAAQRGNPNAPGAGKKGASADDSKKGDDADDTDTRTVAELKEEYDRRVAAGEIQAVESGSGADGALIKADYVKALS
jgi:hypothetical protein